MSVQLAESLFGHLCGAKLSELHRGDVPGRLYHFTSVAGMHGVIASKRMWAFSVDGMNDTTEIRHAASAMRARVERARADESDDHVRPLFDAIAQSNIPFGPSDVYVLSFSGGNDRGLWNLYADRGRGFSFCFPLHAGVRWGGVPVKCNYSDADLDALCTTALTKIRELYVEDIRAGEAPNPQSYADMFLRNVIWLAPIFKQAGWAHENEWRIVFMRRNPPPKVAANGRRYIEVPAPDNGRLPIEAVCAGVAAEAAHKAKIRALLVEHGYGNVKLYGF